MAKILVVDDDPDMRLALKNVLVRDGHQILEAPDGETALDALRETTLELVLLDIRLPGLDGVQTLRRIREMRKDLPVIMITGYGSVETAVELMKIGANHYLQKPFDNQQLSSLVAKTLELPLAVQDVGVLRRALLSKLGIGAGGEAGPSKAAPATTAPPPPPPPPLPVRSSPSASPMGLGKPRKAPPPAPEPGVTISLPAVLVVLGLVLGLGWFVTHRAPKMDNRDFALPTKNPSAVAWSANGLYVADWASESITLLDKNMVPLKTFRVSGIHPTGMAIAKDVLYLCDSWKRLVQKRRLNADLSVIDSKQAPGPSPSGLFFDGTHLWSADSEEGKIYQHDPNSLEPKLFYPAPAKAPVGIYVEGQTMWTADADTRLVYKHAIGPGLPVQEIYGLASLAEGKAPLSAFTMASSHFWLGRDGMALLYKRHPTAFNVEKR